MGITNRLAGWIVDSADRIRQNKASDDLIRRSKNYESKVRRTNEREFAMKQGLRQDRSVSGRMWIDSERYMDVDFRDPNNIDRAKSVLDRERSRPPVIKKVSKKELEKMRKVSPGELDFISGGSGSKRLSPDPMSLLFGDAPAPKKGSKKKTKKTKKRSTKPSQPRNPWDDLI